MTNKAKRFAIEAHGDQQYGYKPYEFHLNGVVSLVAQARDPVLSSDYLESVAWLHDVLENTDVTVGMLHANFEHWVTSSVAIITDSADAKNRKERKRLANATFKILDPEEITHRAALIVKAADRLANIRHSGFHKNNGKLSMYRKEHAAFEAATRREGLVPSFWDSMTLLLGPINPNNI